MTNTQNLLTATPGTKIDGFYVVSTPRTMTIGGVTMILLNGHYGNGVVTTRRFTAPDPVFVVGV